MISIDILNEPLAGYTLLDVHDGAACWNYVLQGLSSCGYSAPKETLSLNVEMNPIQYVNIEDGIEDDGGGFTRSLWVQKKIFSFDAVVDDQALDWLNAMKGYDQLFFGAKSGGPNEITNLQISEPESDGDTYVVTVSFEDVEYMELTGCCGSAFAGSPFEDPCPPASNGEPDSEDPCNDFAISIAYDGSAINATPTGGGTGTVSYRWYYDATGSGVFALVANNVSSVVPAGSGIYKAVATKGACQAEDAAMVQDICSLFTVVLSYQFGMIDSQVIAGQGSPVYTWVFIDSGGAETTLPDTGAQLQPEETGLYRLEVTDGDCTGEDTIYVEVVNECDFTTEITNNGDGTYTVASVGYGGGDSPAYRWDKETPSGLTPFGTDATITPDEQGVYHGYVELDGCEVGSYVLVIGDCVSFKGFIESVIPGSGKYTLYAAAIDAPGAVNYEWYQWSSGMYVSLGSGLSVETTQVGQVRLIAKSGVCEKVDYTEIAMDFVNPYYYQKFILSGGEDHVTVTEFTLPDVVNLHEDRVAWSMEVIENGVEQVYDHETAPRSLNRQQYSIDGQKVQVNSAYTRAGTVIVVKMKKV